MVVSSVDDTENLGEENFKDDIFTIKHDNIQRKE